MTRFTVTIQCFRTDGGIVVEGEDMDGLDDKLLLSWLLDGLDNKISLPILTKVQSCWDGVTGLRVP